MNFNVRADLTSGFNIFRATMNFVPRIGEEIEAAGYIYKVKNVRYVFTVGTYASIPVQLLLEKVK